MDSWPLLLTCLGFLSLSRHLIIPLLTYLSTTAAAAKPEDLKTRYGPWAIVTGSTDGIGLAFAVQLARHGGLNLVLVGRSPAKLKRASAQISSEVGNHVEIRTLAVDFATTEDVERVVRDGVRGLEIGVLVNNVGMTYPGARYFHEVEEEVWTEMVRVNLVGTTMVTRAVLGGMLERGKGAVVSVGSGAAAVLPSHPLFAVYAATKAYVDQLSRSLHVEYKEMGIDVQCQVPLYVATEMTRKVAMIEQPSLFIPSPEAYAEAAVRRIGGEARCTPYWAHSVQWYLARLVPEFLLDSWRLSIGISRRELDIVRCSQT
ncbi:unnamed protein product [Linum trigynum]|uniref:Ketoreductase domain-containing protein n=1 Tax=Linum trigynum TaxID=586398 RepID=A0AAV2GV06_9ROSI